MVCWVMGVQGKGHVRAAGHAIRSVRSYYPRGWLLREGEALSTGAPPAAFQGRSSRGSPVVHLLAAGVAAVCPAR